MEELQRQIETLLAEVAALRAENAELKSQVAELQLELVRRKKGFRPKANTSTRTRWAATVPDPNWLLLQ